jgi:uncharacterized protein (TIGR02466 family)
MPSIQGLFPKLLYSDILNISDAYNEEIKTEIYRLTKGIEKGPESVTNFNIKCRENILDNPVFNPFFSLIREHVSTFCKSAGYYSENMRIVDPWVSITYPGQQHNLHTHGLSTISGVYYVQAEPFMNLHFVNPGSHIIRKDHSEQLETKKLLLFDGSLIHGFPAVNETKITIAFNIIC